MADYGSVVADKAIASVQREVHRIYKQAAKELKEKLDLFTEKFNEEDKEKRELVQKGLLTEEEYERWLKTKVFEEKRWKDKVKQATQIMLHANEEAALIVNEKKMNVFAENYNYQAYEIESEAGIDLGFNLYNTQSVARLMKDKPELLPKWNIDEKKDYKWNYKKVSNSITQGIIQGESIDKITKRLVDNLCAQNENKMRTFARTAITGAQNAGRMQQMEDSVDSGIRMKKRWLATLDNRTRDAHADLDGETAEVDEEFENKIGKIMFPGDPNADPANVYNCRCTMTYVYEGIEQKTVRFDSSGVLVGDMDYTEWKKWKDNK